MIEFPTLSRQDLRKAVCLWRAGHGTKAIEESLNSENVREAHVYNSLSRFFKQTRNRGNGRES